MGIIETLAAGFTAVNRRLWIVALPVLLDLFLWLGPHLSAAPLVAGGLEQYERLVSGTTRDTQSSEATAPRSLAEQMALTRESLARLGETNLFLILASPFPQLLPSPLERTLASPLPLEFLAAPLPSLWTLRLPVPSRPSTLTIEHPATLFGLWFLLVTGGFFLASAYLSALGEVVGGTLDAPSPFWKRVLLNWARLGVLLVLSLAFLLFFLVPAVMLALLLSLVAGILGVMVLLLASVVPLWLRIYLYFVPGALFCAGQRPWAALAQSFGIVQRHFWSSLGLIALILLIAQGFAQVWQSLGETPWGLPVAILGHAYIASGLMAGGMVYYRERSRPRQPSVVAP